MAEIARMPVKLLDGVLAERQSTEQHITLSKHHASHEPMTYMEILVNISTAVAALGICVLRYLSWPLYQNTE